MVGVTSVIIFGHMILVAFKLIKQIKENRRHVPYNNLQFDNPIFNETGIINEDFSNPFNYGLNNLWKSTGRAGLNFLNIMPKLGAVTYKFFGKFFTDLFNGIYNHKINNLHFQTRKHN